MTAPTRFVAGREPTGTIACQDTAALAAVAFLRRASAFNCSSRTAASRRSFAFSSRAWIFESSWLIFSASFALRSWASWLAVVAVVLFPVRDTVGFWGRYLNPNYSFGPLGPIVYPIKWIGGTAMLLALLLALFVFVQGAQRATTK